MSLKELIIKYTDFLIVLDEIRLLSNLSFQIFHEYPNNIPEDIYKPISEDLAHTQGFINLYFDKNKKTNSVRNFNPLDFKPKSPLSGIFMESTIAKVIQEYELTEENTLDKKNMKIELKTIFRKIILEQEFLSYYSIFESYLNSILSIIFSKYPKKLNPKNLSKNEEKNIKWNDILKYDNYEDLIDFMIEKFIYSFGYESLFERFKYLNKNKNFGFKLLVDDEMRKTLNEIDELRNCFTHNGGKVTRKAIKQLNKANLKPGDRILLVPETNIQTYNIFKSYAYLLYIQTANKYFKKEFEEKLKSSVWLEFISKQVYPF